ncbi:MAG: ATP-binding protein [Terracidiphilus sp.]
MFGKPIQEITFAEIVSFLETGVREGTALDFKLDFPSALEKTLAAFANTYGGIILIGIDETDLGAAVLPITGVEVRPGLRERVLQKGLEAVHPPLLPEVHVFEFKSNPSLPEPDRALIVVNLPESMEAPHSVDQRTVVYLRGDNVSTRIERKATVGEIEWLLNKRQRSLELKQRLVANAIDRAEKIRPQRRARNRSVQYWKDGDITLTLTTGFPRLPLMAPREWLAAVKDSSVRLNSAPRLLPIGQIQRVSGGVFFDGEYAYSEYQAQGLILHQFDYWWDYIQQNTSVQRRQLYPNATAALFTSVFKNGVKVFRQAGFHGALDFSFKASDLSGAFIGSPARLIVDIPALVESNVQIARSFTIAELDENWLDIAKSCQRELYWAFGFDAPDKWLDEDFVGC